MSKKFVDATGIGYVWEKVKEHDDLVKSQVSSDIESAKQELQNDIQSNIQSLSQEFTQSLESVQSDVNGLTSEVATVNANFAAVEDSVRSVRSDMDEMATNNESMMSEFNALKTDVETAVAESAEIATEFDGVKKDVTTLRNTVNTYNSSIGNLQTIVGEHDDELNTLRASKDVEGSIDYKFEKFQEDVMNPALELKASIVSMSNVETIVNEVNETVSTINDNMTMLTGDETVEGSVDYKIADLKKDIDAELEKKVNETAFSQLSTSVDDLSAEVDGLGESLANINSDIEGKADKTELEGIEERVEESISAANTNSSDIESLRGRVTTLEGDKSVTGSVDQKIDAALAAFDLPEIPEVDFSEVNSKIEAQATQISEINNQLDVIQGSGEGSIAYAVAQILDGVDEDYDTLKEVATYIASDKTKAAEIESTLSNHSTSISDHASRLATAEAKISAEETRAKGAEDALEIRVKALEEDEGFDATELSTAVAQNTTNIAKNTESITGHKTRLDLLENNEDTKGSVANTVKVAKDEIRGGAEAGVTLGTIMDDLGVVRSSVSDETTRATGVESGLATRISALEESEGNYIEGITSADNLFRVTGQTDNTIQITMSTQDMKTASENADGLVMALDAKTYVDNEVKTINAANAEFDERIESLEVFYGSSITNAEIDAITNPEEEEGETE